MWWATMARRRSLQMGMVMLEQFRSDAIQDCYRRAAEARRTANSASNADARSDFLALERRWLALAHGFDSEARSAGGLRHSS
jgi:hypothetical protein